MEIITSPQDRSNLFHRIISTFTNNNNTVKRNIALTDISMVKITNPSFEFMNALDEKYSKALFNTSYDIYYLPSVHIFENLSYDIALYNSTGHYFKNLDNSIDGFIETIVMDNILYVVMDKGKPLCTNGVLVQVHNDMHGLVISDTDISDTNTIHLKDNLYLKTWFEFVNATSLETHVINDSVINSNEATSVGILTNKGIVIELPANDKTISDSIMIFYTKNDTIYYKITRVEYLFWNKDRAILDKNCLYETVMGAIDGSCTIDSIYILVENNDNVHMEAEEIYTEIYRYWCQNDLVKKFVENDCAGYYLRNIDDMNLRIDFEDDSCYDKVEAISPLISSIMKDAEYGNINNDIPFEDDGDSISFKVINPKKKYMYIYINGKKFNGKYNVFMSHHYYIVTIDKALLDSEVSTISILLMNSQTKEYFPEKNIKYPNLIKLEHNSNHYATMLYIDGYYIQESMYNYVEIDNCDYIILTKDFDYEKINVVYTTKSELLKTKISRADLISTFINFKDSFIFAGGLLLPIKYLFNIEGKNIVNIDIPKSYASSIDNDITIYRRATYDETMFNAKCIKNVFYTADDGQLHLIPYQVMVDFATSNKSYTLPDNSIYHSQYHTVNDLAKYKLLVSEMLIGNTLVNIGDNYLIGNDVNGDVDLEYTLIKADDGVIEIDMNSNYIIAEDLNCNTK